MKLEECLLDGKTECVEEAPAISNETIVAGETERKHLNVSHLLLSCTDRDDLNVKSESTSSELKKEQYFHVKEEVVPLDSKPTNPGTVLLHGPQRQRPPSLHEINSQVASKPCQEVVSAEYYSVIYCPRKPNMKRKGPWSSGVIVCQGRSCTPQDLDGKAVTKTIVQGLKDMPEGATLEVGKFEVEVMKKPSNEEVLSGALYLVDKAPQPVPTELPALTTKKQTFESFKLQHSRDKGPFITQMALIYFHIVFFHSIGLVDSCRLVISRHELRHDKRARRSEAGQYRTKFAGWTSTLGHQICYRNSCVKIRNLSTTSR